MAYSYLTEDELTAVRFYMGDPLTAQEGPYRGGPKAYNTINALLHPGTYNERDKAKEGRVVELEDADQLKSYIRLIVLIYKAMVKYRDFERTEDGRAGGTAAGRTLFRIDRVSSLEHFMEGGRRIAGFFSTCKRGFLPQYARSKSGIVLLEAVCECSVPYLDFEDIFKDYYAKPEEAEIMLPFGAVIKSCVNLPLTDEEKEIYTDINGQPAKGKCRLKLSAPVVENGIPAMERDRLYRLVSGDDTVSRIRKSMEIMSLGRSLTEEDENFYCQWKQRLLRYIDSEICAG